MKKIRYILLVMLLFVFAMNSMTFSYAATAPNWTKKLVDPLLLQGGELQKNKVVKVFKPIIEPSDVYANGLKLKLLVAKRGVKVIQKNVIIVLDESGSMGSITSPRSKRNIARKAAMELVDIVSNNNAGGDTTFSIVKYSTQAKITAKHLTDRDEIKKVIYDNVYDNNTSIGNALKVTREVVKEDVGKREDHIVFLTDGMHNGSMSIANVKALASDIRKGATNSKFANPTIYTVLYRQSNKSAKDLMEAIATKGKFFESSDDAKLMEHFRKMGKEIFVVNRPKIT